MTETLIYGTLCYVADQSTQGTSLSSPNTKATSFKALNPQVTSFPFPNTQAASLPAHSTQATSLLSPNPQATLPLAEATLLPVSSTQAILPPALSMQATSPYPLPPTRTTQQRTYSSHIPLKPTSITKGRFTEAPGGDTSLNSLHPTTTKVAPNQTPKASDTTILSKGQSLTLKLGKRNVYFCR